MEVDPTPITLPCLPLIGPTPSASGQNKRVRTSSEPTGERDMGDSAAFGSGTKPRERLRERRRSPYRPQLRAAQSRTRRIRRENRARRQLSKLFSLPPFSRSLRPLKSTTSRLYWRRLPKGLHRRHRSTYSIRSTQSKKPIAFGPHWPHTSCPHPVIYWRGPTRLETMSRLHFAQPQLLRRRRIRQQRLS